MATTPRKTPSSQSKAPVRGRGVLGAAGGQHHLPPRSIDADRAGSKGRGGKQGHQGKDALFSFDQQNMEMFSLPRGGAAGGGAPGARSFGGPRKARPPKISAEPAAPKGTEGATSTGAGAVAASLSKIFPAPPVRAPDPESLGKPNGNNNNGNGDHLAGMYMCFMLVRTPQSHMYGLCQPPEIC